MVMKKNCKEQFFKKNKKGWIKIVEAFVAILLVAGVFLIVLNKGQVGKIDTSSDIQDTEVGILREIQLDEELRSQILSMIPGESGIEWNDFPNEKVPNYLTCKAKICIVGSACVLQGYPDKDVYSESVIISANLQTFSPKVLKLFCWNE